MMLKKSFYFFLLFLCFPLAADAGELYLEDINFPFDSSAAVDDLKQVSRIAEILKKYPDLFLEINAHTDSIGTESYNQGLSLRRAKAVKELFVEQGISADRIVLEGYGEEEPKSENESVPGRFVNRRAVFSIYQIKDSQKDFFYKNNELIKPIEEIETPAPVADTSPKSDDIMSRLDRLEELIRREKEKVEPSVMDLCWDNKRGSVSGAIGADGGELSGILEGKLFIPLNNNFAFQGGLRGNINEEFKEYQIDGGLIGKLGRFELGVFASALMADLDDYDDSGSLSQFSGVASYLFERGSLGLFLTEGIESEDVIQKDSRYQALDLIITETYLEVQDKFGLTFDWLFEKGFYIDGDVGLSLTDDDDVFAKVKAGVPIAGSGNLRAFVQGTYNDGYLKDEDDYALVAGIEIGAWKYKTNSTDCIRPMNIPTVSYQVQTRTKVIRADINLTPEVFITVDQSSGNPPLSVVFTANASDEDGSIVSYQWDFGDGTVGTGQTVEHTYNESGNFNVRVIVTDDDGAQATDTILISTANTLPQVTVVASVYNGPAPLEVAFTANASDPDGSIESIVWNFDDGSPEATGENVSHTFTSSGEFNVTATVTDNDGGVTVAGVTISTINLLPQISISATPRTGSAPLEVDFNAFASDPDGSIESIVWNFGDGSGEAAGESVSHTFTSPGEFLVTATATDNDGGVTVANTTIFVSNLLPQLSINAVPQSGIAPLEVNFTAFASDPDGSIAGITWEFGDGETGTGDTVTHTYQNPGGYTAVATATDNSGGKTSVSIVITAASP